jgi:hypothetical protein
MKFNLTTEIFDEQTKKLLLHATPNATIQPMTLSQLLMQLLLANSEKPVAADIKAKHYELLVKTFAAVDNNNGRVDLTLSEIGMIKGLADTNCPTLVHGRINAILENPLSGRPEVVAAG